MTTVLDEDGRLLGRVNIIDALVVLATVAIVLATAAIGFGPGGPFGPPASTQHADVSLESTVHPSTANQLHAGLTGEHVQVTSVDSRVQVQQWLTDGGTRERTRVTFTARLPVNTEISDETGVTRVYWTTEPGRERLVIGDTIRLDFGTIVIEPTVTTIDVDVEEAPR